ncbi:CmpA/NrtA family ABC transporter substrate-binding protein [Anthocerotibacter panamensis]|uniref:CmpA/NrtA family ABC transporter substrate-binding protein n=1 Tax=Anthocerotibacter panamensis TaxID=2857077 RepID=UPI001C403F21|nr:CmpA/NrtA family ABC transporter substrate-binding protein [Anthocerotibacter panamensis]
MSCEPLTLSNESPQTATHEPNTRQDHAWLSRRGFLFSAGAVLAQPGYVAAADTPETTAVKVGFVGQTDAAPIIIAKEKGFFAKYGLKDAEIAKQPSWGVTRDNLELGSAGGGLDIAMVLRPMPFLMALGAVTKGNKKIPMVVPIQLNIDGQGITVSNEFRAENLRLDTSVMKTKVMKAKGEKYKFASTFKGGTSDLMMRYWLAAGGVDPDKDVESIIVPGPQLVANMKVGNLSGFCVGDPWHNRAIREKIGYTAFVSGEMWKDHPEKALTMRADWASKNPKTAQAVVAAIQEAQRWCDQPENRTDLMQILSQRAYCNVPVADMIRLTGLVDYGDGRPVVKNSPYVMRFWKANASYPFENADIWFLTENVRWGFLPPNFDAIRKVVTEVNRQDIWRSAAKLASIPTSDIPKKIVRDEVFFDGLKFNMNNPVAYLKGLEIKRVSV